MALFSEVFHFYNGKTIKPGGEGEFPVYGSNGTIGQSDDFKYEDGIIIGRVGAYCGSVEYCPGRFWASDNTIVASPKSDNYDVRYLYYLLNNLNLNRWAGGAAQPLLTQTVLKQIEYEIPEIHTQHKIASILSAYDDLIENNLRRNRILEEMAQLIYREWFVKFRFPGHEKVKMVDSPLGKIPEGWEIRNLLDICDVTYGYAFKSKIFSTEPVGLPVVRIRDVLNGYSSTFTSEPADDKYIVRNGDILIGMDGDFHMGFWNGGEAFLVQRVARFNPKNVLGYHHLFLALQDPIRFFNATITGTTVAHLGHKHIKTIQILIPSPEILALAEKALEPNLQLQLNLRLKNSILRQTRDLLLPKLISGQLDVSELDIDIGETAA